MTSYALDINNQRVINAMDALGIHPSELLNKQTLYRNRQDFAGPHVSEEILDLRYEYYNKKLKETIRRIKAYLKEERVRIIQSQKYHSEASLPHMQSDGHITSVRKTAYEQIHYHDSKLQQAKELYKKKILKLKDNLLENDEAQKRVQAKLNRVKDFSSRSKDAAESGGPDKFSKFREKAQQNKQDLARNTDEMHKKLANRMRQITLAHKERERALEEQKFYEMQNKAQTYRAKQQKIRSLKEMYDKEHERKMMQKLLQIEEKIENSDKRRSEILRRTSEAAIRSREKVDMYVHELERIRSNMETERLLKIIQKQKTVEQRKGQILSTNLDRINQARSQQQVRRDKAQQNIQANEKERESRERVTEKRIRASTRVLEKRKSDWERQLAIRQEIQRLKDEDKLTKVMRARRIFNKKRKELMDKQMMDQYRIDQLKFEREMIQGKQRENALKAMIEKERAQEILLTLSRTPDSKTLKDKLKSLNLAQEREEEESQLRVL